MTIKAFYFTVEGGKFISGSTSSPCIKETFDFCGIVLSLIIYPEGNIVVGADKHHDSNNTPYGKEFLGNIEAKNAKMHMSIFNLNLKDLTEVELFRSLREDPEEQVLSPEYFQITFTTGGETHDIYFNYQDRLEFYCETLAYVGFYPLYYNHATLYTPEGEIRKLGEGLTIREIDNITTNVLAKEFGRKEQWISTKTNSILYPNKIIMSGAIGEKNALVVTGHHSVTVTYFPITGKRVELEFFQDKTIARCGKNKPFQWTSGITYANGNIKGSLTFTTKSAFAKASVKDKLKTIVSITNMLYGKKFII